MARNEQLIRQHKILQILERYRFGRTLPEIRDDVVDELGLTSLHERSVRRDLEALQAAGLDIITDSVARGRIWKLGPGVRSVPKITASTTELLALSLGRDLLSPLCGTPFWLGIESFWTKIRETLPPAVLQHYERARKALFVLGTPPKSYERQQGMLKTVHRAIQEHRRVALEYQPVDKPLQRRAIEPYALIVHQSSLYVVAADQELEGAIEERLRHWKLDRFRKATLTDARFDMPAGFDIERYLRKSAGVFSSVRPQVYRIQLTGSAAAWVSEDPWHPDQRLEWQPDGSALLTVEAGHELEIIPRLLALGDHAELLAPESARRSVARIVESLHRKYGGERRET